MSDALITETLIAVSVGRPATADEVAEARAWIERRAVSRPLCECGARHNPNAACPLMSDDAQGD